MDASDASSSCCSGCTRSASWSRRRDAARSAAYGVRAAAGVSDTAPAAAGLPQPLTSAIHSAHSSASKTDAPAAAAAAAPVRDDVPVLELTTLVLLCGDGRRVVADARLLCAASAVVASLVGRVMQGVGESIGMPRTQQPSRVAADSGAACGKRKRAGPILSAAPAAAAEAPPSLRLRLLQRQRCRPVPRRDALPGAGTEARVFLGGQQQQQQQQQEQQQQAEPRQCSSPADLSYRGCPRKTMPLGSSDSEDVGTLFLTAEMQVPEDSDTWLKTLHLLDARGYTLDAGTVFKVFPIAYRYMMTDLAARCLEALYSSGLWLAEGPRPPAGVKAHQPSLLQWLHLADSLDMDPLTMFCLVKMKQSGALVALRAALAHPASRALLQELRPATLMEVMRGACGFTADPTCGQVLDLCNPAYCFAEPDVQALDGTGLSRVHQNCVLFACQDGGVSIWDPCDQRLVGRLHLQDVHDDCVSSSNAPADRAPCRLVNRVTTMEAAGNSVVTAHIDGSLAVWDWASHHCRTLLSVPKGDAKAIALCGPRTLAAAGATGGRLRLQRRCHSAHVHKEHKHMCIRMCMCIC
mmetsp:Transcript_20585/g.61362  ORF Transcript_20585/g.61362 Transcript_20585/m.61362 type:complete len:579 (-) Transcript_20585:1918-3654(-)